MIRSTRSGLLALLSAALLQGCANDPTQAANDPRVRLETLLEEWQRRRPDGDTCASGGRKYPYVDCGRIQAAIERMALDFPDHPSVLLANAVVAFETGKTDRAIDYLDALLGQRAAAPDAAVLRSRISIMNGNLPHAERLLEEYAQRQPDHAGVYEALASLHYLRGEYAAARRDLRIADRLGAPRWRTSYNLGLIDEARGEDEAAIEHYRDALDAKPEWPEAQARLRGLESRQGL